MLKNISIVQVYHGSWVILQHFLGITLHLHSECIMRFENVSFIQIFQGSLVILQKCFDITTCFQSDKHYCVEEHLFCSNIQHHFIQAIIPCPQSKFQFQSFCVKIVKNDMTHPKCIHCCVDVCLNTSVSFVRMDINFLFWQSNFFVEMIEFFWLPNLVS